MVKQYRWFVVDLNLVSIPEHFVSSFVPGAGVDNASVTDYYCRLRSV